MGGGNESVCTQPAWDRTTGGCDAIGVGGIERGGGSESGITQPTRSRPSQAALDSGCVTDGWNCICDGGCEGGCTGGCGRDAGGYGGCKGCTNAMLLA
jgi:hypothetical protein